MKQTFNFSEKELKEFITCCLQAGMIAATEKGNIPFPISFTLPKEIMNFIGQQLMIIRECHSTIAEQVKQAIMEEYWKTLKATKLVKVRTQDVKIFVEYCKKNHDVYPGGGAITDDNLYQYLYLD